MSRWDCVDYISIRIIFFFFFFFQAEDGIRDVAVTGVQTCALPISSGTRPLAELGQPLPGITRPLYLSPEPGMTAPVTWSIVTALLGSYRDRSNTAMFRQSAL